MTETEAEPCRPFLFPLRELAAFLRRPRLLAPEGLRSAAGWRAFVPLLALHLIVLLLVLLPLSIVAQKGLGLDAPDAFDKISAGWLLPITLLIAPVIEEMLFRGWQTGRPRALWLLLCAILGGAALYGSTHGLAPLAAAGVLLLSVVAGLVGWLVLRRKSAPVAGFAAAFPAIYWIVALLFAGAHLMNYAAPKPLTAVLVLPQLWAGIMLGFTRQRLGLPASMLQHILANGSVILVAQIIG
ncbi:CPBP family intramembrane glutamic endopeptidase [Novosphingobium sp. 9]|uniref:CPBP family intramembrane glutamic endopeptidase n=1 Tax=Novosphingobium sp. 9 TaxID=2025349 RepID=UPI0021B5C8A7|nr:CPBP family intramembrane glutamic endopeptidase [Novosphingobium sp. 9]